MLTVYFLSIEMDLLINTFDNIKINSYLFNLLNANAAASSNEATRTGSPRGKPKSSSSTLKGSDNELEIELRVPLNRATG